MNKLFLPKNTYLSSVISEIPANKIIYKTLTGCGATTLEIQSPRNSILIEPYIPVIECKANKDVFAVHEGITIAHIERYLKQKRKYYKFISTPEGLRKIVEAADDMEIDIYKEFFLLVDECEKLIQDVNYRTSIVDVMDYFFRFNKRSFISATPLAPSDPLFKQHQFDDYYILPDEFKPIDMRLRITNSIASTIKDYFNKTKRDQYLIFINSTERIASIIDFLKIHAESQVFCSQESVDKLRISDIENAQEKFDTKKLRKYNFFTSRFFTAFDIILKSQPEILIISDVIKVQHSALDPMTDVVQICGRARNGVSGITHIANYASSLPNQTPEEVKGYLKGSMDAYLTIKSLRDTATKMGAWDVFNEALKLIRFAKYVNPATDEISTFMIDQEINDKRVKGYYRSAQSLQLAYENTIAFDGTKRYKVICTIDSFKLGDDTLDRLKQGISEKLVMEHITEALEEVFSSPAALFSFNKDSVMQHIIKVHNMKYQYYKVLGIDTIRELKYSPSKIEAAYQKAENNNKESFFEMMQTLIMIFKRKKKATGTWINKVLKFYYKRYNIQLPATVTQLSQWFEVDPNKRVRIESNGEKEIRGYFIGAPKHLGQ